MTAYEMELMQEYVQCIRAEAMDWAVGGGMMLLMLLAVIGLCTVVKAVTAR